MLTWGVQGKGLFHMQYNILKAHKGDMDTNPLLGNLAF